MRTSLLTIMMIGLAFPGAGLAQTSISVEEVNDES